MKIPKEKRDEMRDKMQRWLDNYRRLYPQWEKVDPTKFEVGTLHTVWFRTWASVAYDNTNPNTAYDLSGVRLFKQDPDYNLYPYDTNDTTLGSALMAIRKELK